jgi:erythromycin esterase-like protein
VSLALAESGASWGTISNPKTLLAAARRLVQEGGCSAIAVVAAFPAEEDVVALQAYREGQGVDAVGGAEAIISHLVSPRSVFDNLVCSILYAHVCIAC